MASKNPFVALKEGDTLELKKSARFPEAGHLWQQREIDALTFAWAARRPLLIRGEAGSGKSQIARAAAHVLGIGDPLVEVIHPSTEASDLLYRFDVVQRLSDAQAQQFDVSNERYVRKGPLWEAFDALVRSTTTPVLLIDEIDKADADIPNTLLDVLGNRSFQVPPRGDFVVTAPEGRFPLIVVTTNEERELPAAFVRRCGVLNLNPPQTRNEFIAWLVERGGVHTHLQVGRDEHRAAAEMVWEDREVSLQGNYPKVGLAEFIDLLTAIDDLTRELQGAARASAQRHWLARLRGYALVKGADQVQERHPGNDPGSGSV